MTDIEHGPTIECDKAYAFSQGRYFEFVCEMADKPCPRLMRRFSEMYEKRKKADAKAKRKK